MERQEEISCQILVLSQEPKGSVRQETAEALPLHILLQFEDRGILLQGCL